MTNTRVRPIILAGGNGTRLWPASRETMPKQLCRIEGEYSLFQKTLKRVGNPELFSKPVIVCNEGYAELISTQLAECRTEPEAIICEPFGRDTAAAILLAMEAVPNNQDTLCLVMPSDHEIADVDAFCDAVESAAEEARQNDKIVTFGITPSHPETGFGYLRAGHMNDETGCCELANFIEKPILEKAEQLIQEKDVYWNAGIFLLSRNTAVAEYSANVPELIDQIDKSILNGRWSNKKFLPNADDFAEIAAISFDFAIMEKTDRAAVIPVNPGWSDMGSWKTVWEAEHRDSENNSIRGDVYTTDTDNSLIHSTGPVVGVCGLKDVVVVANRDAVLVTSRENPQGVKDLVKQMKFDESPVVNAHTGEDRPWGKFDSVDRGEKHQVKKIRVEPQGQLSMQYHRHRAEHWIVVSGLATVTVDEKVMQLAPCQQVFIPQGAVHRLENLTGEPVEIIEVQYGDYLGEDDIVRIEDVYGRNVEEETMAKARVA